MYTVTLLDHEAVKICLQERLITQSENNSNFLSQCPSLNCFQYKFKTINRSVFIAKRFSFKITGRTIPRLSISVISL